MDEDGLTRDDVVDLFTFLLIVGGLVGLVVLVVEVLS